MDRTANHPFIVWSACFLWFTSIFSITWSLLLFFCLSDILISTGMDLINAFILLSGIIMVPMNVHILYSIANGKRISRDSNVVCCPLWLCILWVIVVDIAAVFVCAKRISGCHSNTASFLEDGLNNYRKCTKYKSFMDNIQWSLKCCGIESFKDWFSRDWYDKIRDYEWDPSSNRHGRYYRDASLVATDSVPLSCCKSGSCISNYLMELGTHSINTPGCHANLHKVIMITLITYLTLFLLIILDEILLLKFIMAQDKPCKEPNGGRPVDIMHIMSANHNFGASSGSRQLNPNDSEEDSFIELQENKKDDTD